MPQNPEWFTLETLTETGIQVTVRGLNSSIPCPVADITLSANEIISEESAALLASQLEADGADDMDSILMDISLLYGEEIVEPVGPVYLSFAAKDVDADSTVYHIDEEHETVVEMPAMVAYVPDRLIARVRLAVARRHRYPVRASGRAEIPRKNESCHIQLR